MIYVQSPGMFTTVQDLGRFGYGPLGVSPSGAADPISLRIGNLLVENPEGAAALEMTLLGGTFQFSAAAVVAVTGSACLPTLDGSPVPMWLPQIVAAGRTLKIGPTTTGARVYLAIRGAIAVEPFLGSASTHILTRLGGLAGRPLRKGDVLQIHDAPSIKPRWVRRLSPELTELSAPRSILRTTIAPQSPLFSDSSLRAFYAAKYRVTEHSNRMGLRLEGTAIDAPSHGQMVSEGVALGAIQIPAGGHPIILFVEQQTTGGYPKIANIISADLPCVGQLRPNDVVRFELVAPKTARNLIFQQERMLRRFASTLARG